MNYNSGKCPCCGYEYDYDWQKNEPVVTKGDEGFIRIDCLERPFETDHRDNDYFGEEYEKAYLYDCPKCRNVHFQYAY